jgi:hypothetical protein
LLRWPSASALRYALFQHASDLIFESLIAKGVVAVLGLADFIQTFWIEMRQTTCTKPTTRHENRVPPRTVLFDAP